MILELKNPGKCYGLVIEHKDDEIVEYFISEFENSISIFDGFLQTALQLGKSYEGQGFKHLDFGLMKFNFSNKKSLLFLIVTNESISKRIGFKTLKDVITLFESKYIDDEGELLQGVETSVITENFRGLIQEQNLKFQTIFEITSDLRNILEERQIDEELYNTYAERISDYLNQDYIFDLSPSQRNTEIRQIIDSLEVNI